MARMSWMVRRGKLKLYICGVPVNRGSFRSVELECGDSRLLDKGLYIV